MSSKSACEERDTIIMTAPVTTGAVCVLLLANSSSRLEGVNDGHFKCYTEPKNHVDFLTS